MNDKKTAQNSNMKTKHAGIDAASIKPFRVDANLLTVGTVETAGKFTEMKISKEKIERVLRELM